MNKRIREIYQKSVDNCVEHSKGKGQSVAVAWLWEEEFGKLIVQECLNVLDPSDDLTSMHEEMERRAAMQIIKEHFGI